MVVDRYYDVTCSVCSRCLSTDFGTGLAKTEAQAETMAKGNGFKTRNGKNLCPFCAAEKIPQAKSKFDYDVFTGDIDAFAASSQRYTKDEAIRIFLTEKYGYNYTKEMLIGIRVAVRKAYVRYRVGRNEDNERCVGWWLEDDKFERSCPVFEMHFMDADEVAEADADVICVGEWLKGQHHDD